MDTRNFEDMLFGGFNMQMAPEDALSEDSEDELLFPTPGEEAMLWSMWDSSDLALPTPGTASRFQEEYQRYQNNIAQRPIRDRHWVIARIEAMIEKIVNALFEEHETLTITLKSRGTLSRKRTAPAADDQGVIPEPKERDLNFPGANAQEAWNFTVLLRILELIHSCLIADTTMTKRDIYYRHPDLFVKQSVVDRYVDDLACTFSITRSQLNVTAAAKGLLAGHFRLIRHDGHDIDGMSEKEGVLVPNVNENDILELTEVHWVLVIEKEATFRSLVNSPQWKILSSNGLVLTAKGYPDVASRKFLSQIADRAPRTPMYALVDLDPDGIAILSTYKYGSYRLAHENVTCTGTTAPGLPNIRWLGVNSHHMSRSPVGEEHVDGSVMSQLQGLMRLTARDRTKAARMLEWNLCDDDGPEQCWRQELQMMLMLNIKAEMQILDELPGGLVSWLSYELGQAQELVRVQPMDEDADDGMLF
ncbi:hypothetical protein G6011_03240 [Alternaria panax]|uniref:DNA topoisomerase (ATP-hydrolyzing) n=1 Tax=Alternaria panax TaxID=48097 RepID=A0AAD4IEQ3_9PLEO|nr:hypothetical protein G6011_03240 [Alternaria panax]